MEANIVKKVLKKSGLSSAALMVVRLLLLIVLKIYDKVQDSKKDYLDKNQFLRALKLVAIHQ